MTQNQIRHSRKSTGVAIGIAAVIAGSIVATLHHQTPTVPVSNPPPYSQFLPNSSLTPGDTLPVTSADVCTPGYAGKVRNVPDSEKEAIYREYGIATHAPGEYEVDHLISLELGGSNKPTNLWPQSYLTSPWNAHVKDKLEDALHSDVCKGTISLSDAQTEIRTDWIAAYKKEFNQ